jgi:hypothetical protein
MKKILTKKNYIKLIENINVSVNDTIYIHHPITEDIVTVNVIKKTKDKLLVSIPENSKYYGQPDFYINKTSVLGV